MAEQMDIQWVPFDVTDGQKMILDVEWGAQGEGRAEASISLYDKGGALIGQHEVTSAGWEFAETVPQDTNMIWVANDDIRGLESEFTWIADGDEFVLVDPESAMAIQALRADSIADDADVELNDLIASGDVVFGEDITMGDLVIGDPGPETYRITSANAGETVTIVDFPAGGGAVLDISDLLASGSAALDVSYDRMSESSVLTVSGAGEADTVIVVQGIDLTIDFDTYVLTQGIV